MTRRTDGLGAALAALTASALAWSCGGNTVGPIHEGSCSGSDGACEVSVVPECAADASCVFCADGGCGSGASEGGPESANPDGAPPECDGGPCRSCVSGGDCTPLNPCHRGITECIGGAPYCVDMVSNAPPGTTCGGGNVCEDGSCVPSCDGSPSCSTSGASCPGPGCDSGAPCAGDACDAGNAGPTCTMAGMSCPLVGLCYYGVIQCRSGEALCDTGMPVPDGTSCGSSGQVCLNAICNTQMYVHAVMPSFSSPNAEVNGILFAFTDILSSETASAFSATLDWGDGNTSAATVEGSAGMFTVSGSHSYDSIGNSTITVTITDTVTGTVVTQTCSVSINVTEYSTRTTGNSIAAGPDGNLWFTEPAPYINSIASITTAGVVSEYNVPTVDSQPNTITAGPDGNLWFTEENGNKIGMMTLLGAFTEFDVPTLNSQPTGITAGPDGNLWFAELAGDQIGRITPTGTITEFPIPVAGAMPMQITAGPDGNVWFTTQSSFIGRITPVGAISTFSISSMDHPYGIATGPDGNLWFADQNRPYLGKVAPDGTVTELGVGTASFMIAAGPDGNLWFTTGNYGQPNDLGHTGPAGGLTLYSLGSILNGITAGPDGNMWIIWDEGIAKVKP